MAGMFGRVKVWRIAKLKVFGERIEFDHKDTIYKLKFGEPRTNCQIRQTFPLPNIPAVRYYNMGLNLGVVKHTMY